MSVHPAAPSKRRPEPCRPPSPSVPTRRNTGRGLGPGLGLNLLVADLDASLAFQTGALDAEIVWREADFAILGGYGSTWMIHSDRAYRNHPLGRAVAGLAARGAGAELRLYGCDPDRAAARAEGAGGAVLCPPLDKPHGLREAFLVDPDGYVWAPGTPLPPAP